MNYRILVGLLNNTKYSIALVIKYYLYIILYNKLAMHIIQQICYEYYITNIQYRNTVCILNNKYRLLTLNFTDSSSLL